MGTESGERLDILGGGLALADLHGLLPDLLLLLGWEVG